MSDTYFVIRNSDGDTTVEEVTGDELRKRLNTEDPYYGSREFFDKMPTERDTNYWGNNVLIIKGEIVTPKPKEVVTRYDI